MPPTTRASSRAPTTPEIAVSKTSFASPGRRKPHCQTCKKPRKGHPRQGCPERPTADVTTPDFSLADALNSLHLDSEAEHMVASAAHPSPSTSVGKNPFLKAESRRRQEHAMAVAALDPPSSAMAEQSNSPPSQRAELVVLKRHEETSKSPTKPTDSAHRPIALSSRTPVRSASINAREDFLDDLSHVTRRVPVSVYVVPAGHAAQLQPFANKIGFYTATVMPEDDSRRDEALLVIGTENAAVEDVCGRLASEATAATSHGGSYRLAQVAGGAVVGAAALFAGLSL
ncbi:unnamed protein product [Peniophora sp. CBMAI 1063]|nr:unnamed protein product [Peniophora sp. CBMAI 1063]